MNNYFDFFDDKEKLAIIKFLISKEIDNYINESNKEDLFYFDLINSDILTIANTLTDENYLGLLETLLIRMVKLNSDIFYILRLYVDALYGVNFDSIKIEDQTGYDYFIHKYINNNRQELLKTKLIENVSTDRMLDEMMVEENNEEYELDFEVPVVSDTEIEFEFDFSVLIEKEREFEVSDFEFILDFGDEKE